MTVDILNWLDNEEPVKSTVKAGSAPTLTSEIVSGTCFEVSREVLLYMMEKAVTVVPSRDMVPVLTNFQFHVTETELKVIASSLDMSMVISTTEVETKVPGVQVFPARRLLSIVKDTVPGSKVYIEVVGNSAVIVSGGFSIELALSDGSGFPLMPDLGEVEFHKINRAKFVEAISTVKYALPGRDHGGQASLKMINIKQGKFTACDGSRFQQARIEGFSLNMQLPSESIPVLSKFLTAFDQEVLDIGEVDTRLVFRLGRVILYLNKLGGPYPNVEQLWLRPALSNDQMLRVNKAELITAIKQVKNAAENESAIALMLDADTLEVRAKDINNTAKAVIKCVWKGKPKAVVVNYTHLAEMLRVYTVDECVFMFGADTAQHKAPILLKDENTQAIATVSQMQAYRAGLTNP
jgi:DNA polymerase-3 subunit beta